MKHSHPKPGFCLSMKTFRDFSSLLLLLFATAGFAQFRISGTVTSENGEKIAFAEVYNKTAATKSVTDQNGFFTFEVAAPGNYDLVFYADNFAVAEQTVVAPIENLTVSLSKINQLSEVLVQKEKDKIFALNRLKDVEETAIYAGKKTEVISIGRLTANKATNNARQIFAQVVGLTINESSDGGLQLSIGGRGLDPNRTSNFNTRQNGYDISADVLGYPESYYAPPTEALDEIQIIRGAASLQYGTQFGGLVNFKLKTPAKKNLEITIRNTIGSYGLYTNFTSLGGKVGKFSYYTYFNYKKGDGFRPNSEFESKNYFANLNYQFTSKTSLHFDYTHFDYLAQQAGGLTDEMFAENPQQSNRSRNWFAVNWNLFALRLKHKFENSADFSLQLFGLDASRKTVGYRSNRVSSDDPILDRDLIIGDFVNWGAEARYLQPYKIGNQKSTFLVGVKYYQSENEGLQGPGSSGSNADFHLANAEFPTYPTQSDYHFPNLNYSVFGENIFRISSQFSITPGFRFEKIRTQADGYYRKINLNNAGDVILDRQIDENVIKERDFVLLGLGLSYKLQNKMELYGNISQNYRSVTFNDIRTASPSFEVSATIGDEKGYTSDIGIRGQISNKFTFDASIFGLLYQNKIGEYDTTNDRNQIVRFRDNLGTAATYGFETLIDWSLNNTFFEANEAFSWHVFSNVAVTGSEYLKSDIPAERALTIKGNEVEFVPLLNIKTGTGIGYKNLMTSLQFTYLSSQFTAANNAKTGQNEISSGITGEIPSYYVADFSASYKWKSWKLEAGITNFTDHRYFTRRATGYPGPGIIPSDPRTFYTTLEFVF